MYLRKLTEHDTMYIVPWRNKNAEFFPPQPPLTSSTHQEWFCATYRNNPADHMYIVCAPFPVGTCALDLRTREIGRVMRGRPDGEKGAMTSALTELMDLYSFGSYYVRVMPGNTHAIKFYRKLGFREFPPQPRSSMLYMERLL